MIKQFRSLNPLNIFLLILTALVLKFPFWDHLNRQVFPNFQEFYIHLLIPPPTAPLLGSSAQLSLGLICLIAQALLFNTVVNTHNLIGKSSFMPALLYIVCGSFFESFAFFSPVMVCNFLIIWLLNRFLSMYRQNQVRNLVFDVGMIIACGTIIYTPFIFMFPLVWISLMIFRPFNWREWFIGLLGFLTVVFFLIFYYYWNDALSRIQAIWMPSDFIQSPEKPHYWMILPLLLIATLGLIQLRLNFFKSVVHIRKSFQLLSIVFIAAILSANSKFGVHTDHYLLAVAPLSVVLAYYFMHAKKRWLYESLFLGLLGSVLYFQLF